MRRINSLRLTIIPVIIVFMLLLTFMVTSDFPFFGYHVEKRVGQYYINYTLRDVGAYNTVSAIIWDYRGYDTLGETTVLFTAIIVVLVVFKGGIKFKK